MSPVEGVPNSTPILPPDEAHERAPVILPRGPAALTSQQTAIIDPISVVAELLSGATLPPPAAGLAEQLLNYVSPRIAHPEALTPPLIIPLLGAAAEHVGHAAIESDEI